MDFARRTLLQLFQTPQTELLLFSCLGVVLHSLLIALIRDSIQPLVDAILHLVCTEMIVRRDG